MSGRARCIRWLLLALALPLRGWAGLVPMGASHRAVETPAPTDHAMHGHLEHADAAAQPAADQGHTAGHHLSPCCVAIAPPLSSAPVAIPMQASAQPPMADAALAPVWWPAGERPPRA